MAGFHICGGHCRTDVEITSARGVHRAQRIACGEFGPAIVVSLSHIARDSDVRQPLSFQRYAGRRGGDAVSVCRGGCGGEAQICFMMHS